MQQNTSTKVSVLITAYNREHYIGEAIDSVLESTFADFEIIILDDASTDKTFSIAESYLDKDSRIKVYRNDHNLGQFANRNKAATYASGEYIKYVDSDDCIYPYTLSMMLDAMSKFPNAGLGFCYTEMGSKFPFPYQLEPEEAFEQHFFSGGVLFIGPSGLIIKRKVFEEVGGFEEFGMPSDNHFTLKVAAKYPVVALSRDLFWWRYHDGQVFVQNKKHYQNVLNNYQYIKDVVSKHSPLEDQKNKLILRNQHKIFFLNLFRIFFKKGKVVQAFTLLQKFYKGERFNN